MQELDYHDLKSTLSDEIATVEAKPQFGDGRVPLGEVLGTSRQSLKELIAEQLVRANTERILQLAEVVRLTELKALLEANPETERILQLMGQRMY
jgi:hypothetical protein